MKPHRNLVRGYEQDLRLFRTRAAKAWLAVLIALWLLTPVFLIDPFWLSVLNYAGIAAVGALGLNLLTGYTGQVSLGHAFFLAIGAYTWAHFGGEQHMDLPVWLLLSAVIGGVVGALVGPFALRLRGNYLAIVSLGLVFIGTHIWNNWQSVTGGSEGVSGERAATIGSFDFADLHVAGKAYSREQGYFWLIWFVVGLSALFAKNIVRTRPGRALQAIRDRDVAAAVIGVDPARYKVVAFALSGVYAAVSGALLGSYRGYLSPDEWSLLLSIQFIAIIIVGGVGTIFGSVLGALFIAGAPLLIEEYASSIPLVSWLTDQGGMAIDTFNQLLFGVVIILFLVLEPHGLAGIWFRIKAYFKAWPFSY
ncbi:MAG TPA: branched-chain amino acid ABC transporter permease [Acidimicrobiales bacterium]